MKYELDFIGINEDTKDATAIGIRWINTDGTYTIGVFDGGLKVYGEALEKHMNTYYFESNEEEKIIDFVICSHSDEDHASGLCNILENFKVKALYMNRPWLYVDELHDKVYDRRITEKSLEDRLKKDYPYIAKLEEIAIEKDIPVYEAFQGDVIEEKLQVYSPTKSLYLDLIVESKKTELKDKTNETTFTQFGKFLKENAVSLMEKWTEEMLHDNVSTTPENEMSIIICGDMEQENFLLTGDAGVKGLEIAMDYADYLEKSIRENVRIYQIPHHGSRNNITTSIMNRLVGDVVSKNEITEKVAIACAAKESKHPHKIVINAFIRRGVKTYKTASNIIHHHKGMPKRTGWSTATREVFNIYVEDWDE